MKLEYVVLELVRMIEQYLGESNATLSRCMPTIPLNSVPPLLGIAEASLSNRFTEEWYLEDLPTLQYADLLTLTGHQTLLESFKPYQERKEHEFKLKEKYRRKHTVSETEVRNFIRYNIHRVKEDSVVSSTVELDSENNPVLTRVVILHTPTPKHYPIKIALERHNRGSIECNLDIAAKSIPSNRVYHGSVEKWISTHFSFSEFMQWAKEHFDNPDFRQMNYDYRSEDRLRQQKNKWRSRHSRKHPIREKSDI